MNVNTNTLTALLALIRDQHHVELADVTADTSLADVGLDSLAVAELLFSIEDHFKINLGNVPPDAFPATVGEVVEIIDSCRQTMAL